MAYDYSLAAIVLSNHARYSCTENFVMHVLKTSMVKSVIGSVCCGRPTAQVCLERKRRLFMYSFCAYGEAGVETATQIFRALGFNHNIRHRILIVQLSSRWEYMHVRRTGTTARGSHHSIIGSRFGKREWRSSYMSGFLSQVTRITQHVRSSASRPLFPLMTYEPCLPFLG